jgi:predicted ATPase
MKVRHVTLKNWMNFRNLDSVELSDRVFVIGPNASGKSNFLDGFRFLRDIARPAGVKPSGGGLQKAVNARGQLSKLRCINSRRDNEVLIEVELEVDADEPRWTYKLGFKGEGKANNRVTITREEVSHGDNKVLERPDSNDLKDNDRLTQTYLEQINANSEFRSIAHFFSEITYLHLVPNC